MKSPRLLLKLLPTYLLITVLVIILLLWFTLRGVTEFNHRQTEKRLLASTGIAREIIYDGAGTYSNYEELCDDIGKVSSTRLTIINLDGQVLGDSEKDAEALENHADRPEFLAALKGGTGTSARYSQTLHREMLYVALPVLENGDVSMIVRSSVPLQSMREAILPLRNRLVLFSIAAIIVAMLISYLSASRITKAVTDIRDRAESFAGGDFETSVPYFRISEFDSLADSMNKMSRQLQQRINTITSQRNEQQAVLASMVEGVLAVDLDEKIIRINESAANLLDCDPDHSAGHLVPELIRHPGLQEFIRNLLTNQESMEEDIEIIGLETRYIRASGAPMADPDGETIGVVVVLNDFTRLKQLENLRQDFVGNVAHELKTPLTSIKGFVDTLRNGALDKQEDARRFLDIIGRQANRLDAILDDLMRLSKLEQQREHNEIVLEPTYLKDLLDGSVRDCKDAAAEKSIKLNLNCDSKDRVIADPVLLRQAVTNLIDNSVKYSDSNTQVDISAERNGNRMEITISDQGIGIAKHHIPRLFERFYRVEKSRSRKEGGTGLGLAIVKHIVLAHEGHVSVTSKPGSGSVFTIELAAA